MPSANQSIPQARAVLPPENPGRVAPAPYKAPDDPAFLGLKSYQFPVQNHGTIPESETLPSEDVPRWLFRPLRHLDPIVSRIWYGDRGEPALDKAQDLKGYKPMSVWGWYALRVAKARCLGRVPSLLAGVASGLLVAAGQIPWPFLLILILPYLNLRVLHRQVLLPNMRDMRLAGMNYQQIVAEMGEVAAKRYLWHGIVPAVAGLCAVLAAAFPDRRPVLLLVFMAMLTIPILRAYGWMVNCGYWQVASRRGHARGSGMLVAVFSALLGSFAVFLITAMTASFLQTGPPGTGNVGLFLPVIMIIWLYPTMWLFPWLYYLPNSAQPTSSASAHPVAMWHSKPNGLAYARYVGKEDWPDA